MHIRSLRVRDLRSISTADLEFLASGYAPAKTKYPNVNVLLGSNGSGKTTILRAIAMSVLAPVLEGNSGFVSDGYVRRLPAVHGKKRASGKAVTQAPRGASVESIVSLEPQDLPSARTPASLLLSAQIMKLGDLERLKWVQPKTLANIVQDVQHRRESSAFFLVGYGATRRVEQGRQVDFAVRNKTRVTRYERVAGLFEEHYSLVPLSSWLPEYATRNPGRYKQVINLLNQLLPESCQLRTATAKTAYSREFMFNMEGVEVPFRALSDGFRAYVGWIGDMLFHLCMGAPKGQKLVDNKGVVLIDEIDLHLHPEWQRIVLPKLSEVLPNIQFIVTTHSPLVVGSLQRQNIQRLRVTEEGTVAESLPERVHGKSAGQILLSPYFGLESTRAPDVAQELEKLRSKRGRGAQEAALEYLRLLASGDL